MKAILIIDEMPENCAECPMHDFLDDDNFDDSRTKCRMCRGVVNDDGFGTRPKWCPLKPMERKWEDVRKEL